MKHIKPDRCGYDGFVCKGITKLNTYFDNTPIDIFATEAPTNRDAWVWPPTGTTVSQATIDNYAQIPQSFEGFVMTLNPVIDMSGGTDIVEVPELSCRTNMDPFSTGVMSVQNSGNDYTVQPNTANSGLVDLYNQVTQYFNDVYDTVDNTGHYHLRYTIKPAYNFTVGPGLLEPMLDTMFPPVGVDTITSPDTLGDFTVWLFDEFNTWKGLVDDRLRNLYTVVPRFDYSKLDGLINLENAKNITGGCYNFTITSEWNDVIGVNIGTTHPALHNIIGPKYTAATGKFTNYVVIDGSTVEVTGKNFISGTFDAYLDVFKYDKVVSGVTSSVFGATIAITSFGGKPVSTDYTGTEENPTPIPGYTHYTFEYIGGVKEVTAGNVPISGGSAYTLYEIEQGDCIYEISLSGGTGTTVVGDYKGPFKLKISGPTVYLAQGELLPTEEDPSAVVGAPVATTEGETASRDYSAYTVDIVDGANSIPPNGNTHYAGYVITEGMTYDDVEEHTFSVDESTTATSYLLLTKTLFGWASEYKEYPGRTIPDTARTLVPGTTINLAGAAVDDIIEGYTVTSIDNGTVSYTDGTTTGKAEPDEQYLVQLGVVSGGTIGQVQYGDIYIDKQDIPEPQPVVGGTYSGPFTVTVEDGTATIDCDDCPGEGTGGTISIAGYYSINGTDYDYVTPKTVTGVTAGDYIYLQFSSDEDNPVVASTTASTSPGVYNVLLARVTTGDAAQLHYGNIHVDGRWS